jgi:hypothetical protein
VVVALAAGIIALEVAGSTSRGARPLGSAAGGSPSSASASRVMLSLPAPTGPYRVGTVSLPVSDPSTLSAPAAALGRRPVVLFSPGLTELRSDDTALDADLARRGYVVAAIDHPHESAVVEFPNGRVIRGSFHDSSNATTSARLRGRLCGRGSATSRR